jgi:hypothetical protein
VHQARIVVTLVQEFEDAGQNLGFFVRQFQLLCASIQELASQGGGKVRRKAENVLVSSEQALLMTHNNGYYGAGQRAASRQSFATFVFVDTDLPTGGLSKLSCIFLFICSGNTFLVGFDGLVTRPSRVLNDRLNMLSKSQLVLSGLERMGVLTLRGSKERQKNLERVESVLGF